MNGVCVVWVLLSKTNLPRSIGKTGTKATIDNRWKFYLKQARSSNGTIRLYKHERLITSTFFHVMQSKLAHLEFERVTFTNLRI